MEVGMTIRAVDDGYFPPGSMLRRVHQERAVGLLYGQRALCIGALNPLNYVGTSDHTRQKLTPFQRLVHTAKAFETIFFGTREEADRVLAYVERMHREVRGRLREPAGPFAAGTPYSAFDPALMLWTVAVIADSGEVLHELLVGRLDDSEREALWQDYLRFGELFGMPRDVAPSTHREFRAYWHERLASPELHLTDEARLVGRFTAFEIPLPTHLQPAKRVHDLIVLGSLPQRVREIYGLRWTPAHRAAFPAAIRAARAGRALAPKALRRGWNTGSFDLVARTERWRIAHGRPTPQVIDDPPSGRVVDPNVIAV
jgi:uncharacterized protein (DUF2236 family)